MLCFSMMAGRLSVSLSSDQVLKNSQFLCFLESYVHSLEENLESIQKDMEELKSGMVHHLR